MSSETIASTSPQAPSDVVAEAPSLDGDAVAALAARARNAQREWWALGAAGRSAALAAAARDLRARRDEATQLVIREVGKPLGEAGGEVARAIAILEYYAQAAFAAVGDLYPPSLGGLLYSERRPHGVAGLITPWNFPIAIPLWKAAPALISGNAVVLKPSPDALGTALFLEQLLRPHLPADLFLVAPGGPDAGEAVVAEADVVSFTGSAGVGAAVTAAAARHGLPVQAEMGGQNAAIVLPDVDPAAAAAMIAGAAMGYAGQKCTATRRVLVIGENAAFTEALVAAVSAMAPSDPSAAGVAVGPVINEAAREKVLAGARAASEAGGRVLTGGAAPARDGWFVEPTLVEGLSVDHSLMQEETFGPLAAVHHVRDLDEAIAIANGVRFGLVTSLHGKDLSSILRGVAALDSGLIKVNAPTSGVDFYAPFGGEKESSYGLREQGPAALDFYSSTRTISIAP
jgi:alpha-ketoglutaric semialdehyde dehydrogenase